MHIISSGALHVLANFKCVKADVQERVTRKRSLKREIATNGNTVRMFCTDELYDRHMEILQIGNLFYLISEPK